MDIYMISVKHFYASWHPISKRFLLVSYGFCIISSIQYKFSSWCEIKWISNIGLSVLYHKFCKISDESYLTDRDKRMCVCFGLWGLSYCMMMGGLDVLRYALIHCDILSHEETAVLVDCGCSLLIGMICSMKKIDILQVDEETSI